MDLYSPASDFELIDSERPDRLRATPRGGGRWAGPQKRGIGRGGHAPVGAVAMLPPALPLLLVGHGVDKAHAPIRRGVFFACGGGDPLQNGYAHNLNLSR